MTHTEIVEHRGRGSYGLSKRARILQLHRRGCSAAAAASLAHTTLSYARSVLSEAGLSAPRYLHGPARQAPVNDPDIIARREHVERQKALFRKAAGR